MCERERGSDIDERGERGKRDVGYRGRMRKEGDKQRERERER